MKRTECTHEWGSVGIYHSDETGKWVVIAPGLDTYTFQKFDTELEAVVYVTNFFYDKYIEALEYEERNFEACT